MLFPKPKRLVDEKVLQSVREKSCAACWAPPPSDPAHIKTRGAGGPDTDWNVIPLCRTHHIEQHKIGWCTFLGRYWILRGYLQNKGWTWGGNIDAFELWNDKLGPQPVLDLRNQSDTDGG